MTVTQDKLRSRLVGEQYHCPLTRNPSVHKCACRDRFAKIGAELLDDDTTFPLYQCQVCSEIATSEELEIDDG